MIEPRLEDYGLNDKLVQEVERKRKIEEKLLAVFHYTIVGIGLTIWLIVIAPYQSVWHFILFLFAYVFMLWIVLGISIGLSKLPFFILSRLYNKHKKNKDKYDKAMEAYKEWDYRNKELFWTNLSGFAYEKEVSKLFVKQGYEVTTTKGTGDGGVDIILKRNGKITIVQCKNTKKPTGPAIVRDLYGTMINFRAHEAILVSSSGCSKEAIKFIFGKPITVMSLANLIEMNQ